ncbi:FecR family protein [Sphingobacterium faecale]|uniref:DUF4974 domain-containing protein n=1 Tax=Sphingobacterium faecale TaxID=2803775 RepID=A0ABS1QYI5_9SPHI|nr:FecR domain-containing protein [Sphingobacterium faecale]MBL1407495.1 DUF4974 domain-containing protein [Sphingobacterium faecale]
MEKENIKDILQKAGKKDITPQEEDKVRLWLLQLHQQEPSTLSEEQIKEAGRHIWTRLQQPQPTIDPVVRRLWSRWVAAVAMVCCIAAGALYYFNMSDNTPLESVYGGDVTPGKTGATLTLADGTQIHIDDAQSGDLAEQFGVKISKDADGQIIYEINDKEAHAIGYNTLTTTRGEQTKVRLPDGTLVFLNALSSLRYPTSFADNTERTVSLSGEGYFQVTKAYQDIAGKKQVQTFVVETNQQKVRVLGTRFNINAFNPDLIVTTLEEGAVLVSSTEATQRLRPGEQVHNNGQQMILGQANMDEVLGWKDGNFIFMGVGIHTVMEQVSRWYDVDVVYNSQQIGGLFYVNISRDKNLSEILSVLEKTSGIRFKIEGRRVIVGT